MMFSLGKPVFVLVKKSEEEDLRKKLPSNIVWKRVIPYGEFIDIEDELSKQIQSRPLVKLEPPLAEEVKKVVAEIDPAFARDMEAKLQEIKIAQEEKLKDLKNLLKKARLGETISQEREIEIPASLEKQIDDLSEKVERIEKLVGFPESPEIAILRGNWHFHRKEYDRALELYDWASVLDSNFRQAWYGKGVILNRLGRDEEAIDYLDKAIEIKKDDLNAWYNKGATLADLERHEKAKCCFEEALRINPNDVESLISLAEISLVFGDSTKGLDIAQKALGLAKGAEDKASSWVLYISAFLLKGKNKKPKKR